MKKNIILALSVVAVVLSGCATLSESECLSGNWYQIGYKDGKSGRSSDYIVEHESACIEYKVLIDRDTYQQGRTKGLDLYCNSNRGYQLGYDSQNYNSSCSVRKYPGFKNGYIDGLLAKRDYLLGTLSDVQYDHDVMQAAILLIENEEEKERLDLELKELDDNLDGIKNDIDRVDYLLGQYR